jgi:hypothetical protein
MPTERLLYSPAWKALSFSLTIWVMSPSEERMT